MSHDYSSGSEHYPGTRHAGPTNSAGTVKPAGGNKCACYTKIKITEKDGFSQTWGRQIRNPQLLSIQMRYGMSFGHSDPFQRPVKYPLTPLLPSLKSRIGDGTAFSERLQITYPLRFLLPPGCQAPLYHANLLRGSPWVSGDPMERSSGRSRANWDALG